MATKPKRTKSKPRKPGWKLVLARARGGATAQINKRQAKGISLPKIELPEVQ